MSNAPRSGGTGGAYSHVDGSYMQRGDTIFSLGTGKRGVAGEFMPDGDVDVAWDDGTHGQAKWHRCYLLKKAEAAAPSDGGIYSQTSKRDAEKKVILAARQIIKDVMEFDRPLISSVLKLSSALKSLDNPVPDWNEGERE